MNWVLLIAALAAIAVIVGAVFGIRWVRAYSSRSAEQNFQLTSEIDALRAARAGAESKLAAEQVRAERASELERSLQDTIATLESTWKSKAAAETQLATLTQSASRSQELVDDLQTRLAASEKQVGGLQEAWSVARSEKAAAEGALKAQHEAIMRLEEEIKALRQRLAGAEAGLTQAEGRFRQLMMEKATVESTLSAREEARRRNVAEIDDLRSRLGTAEARLADGESRLVQLQIEKSATEQSVVEKATMIGQFEKLNEERLARVTALEAALESARNDLGSAKELVAKLSASVEQERRQGEDKLKALAAVRDEMTSQFSTLAEGILVRHGNTFAKFNKDQIEAILVPLRQKIAEFESQVSTTHSESARERETLVQQIRQIAETGATMSRETKALGEALRGNAQTHGAWGEMILDTILERSGLRQGEHYDLQISSTHEEADAIRPDVVIHLPGGQNVVVDSKVSLASYDRMVNATDPVEREGALQAHVAAMRSHITGLGSKGVSLAIENTLDYVVMFVPIEGALAAALQADPSLTALAASSNVAITSPTTLMIALRTIANVWQVDARNRNAEEIAERAGQLYNKFASFIGDMHELGNSLDAARQQFDFSMEKLVDGKGNIVGQLEVLRGLGARASAALPATLLEAAGQHDAAGSVAGPGDAAGAEEQPQVEAAPAAEAAAVDPPADVEAPVAVEPPAPVEPNNAEPADADLADAALAEPAPAEAAPVDAAPTPDPERTGGPKESALAAWLQLAANDGFGARETLGGQIQSGHGTAAFPER